MSVLPAVLITLGICVFAAILEGVCAGSNVKQFFAKLKFPSYAPPLWFWYLIGIIYYATFSFVIYRILRIPDASLLKQATLALIIFMMIANAAWNWIFFRAQKLFVSFIVVSVFPLFDVVLFLCLLRLDETAAWVLIPYLLYRVYSLWWGYGMWKMNRDGVIADQIT